MFDENQISCPHFAFCSGCEIDKEVHLPPVFLEAKHFFRERNIDLGELHNLITTGWRLRAKLAIRNSASDPHIGLYKEYTHDVIDIPLCKVHHPKINEALTYLRKAIIAEQVLPYSETTHCGDWRYLQCVVERATQQVQLSIVANFLNFESFQAAGQLKKLHYLWEAAPQGFWHSMWINFNQAHNNVIFGQQWKLFGGHQLLWERVAGVDVCFKPSSFAQANLEVFEKMLVSIADQIPQNSKVTEFYSGVGVIGLSLVNNSKWVRCCEINNFSEECFIESRNRLPPEVARKISFHVGKAEELQDLAIETDVVIVDPPRKGLAKSMLNFLCEKNNFEKLIYISCGWQAFQRDCDQLLSAQWTLEKAEAYLFFPGSNQIEILAIFKRKHI